jgi:sugar-specific transcriptional regulator TrmB
MVYDILGRLVNKGVVRCIENDPKLYVPVPYKELFKSLKDEYVNKIETIEADFDRMETEYKSENYIINIDEYESMIGEVKNLIRNAKSEIYISMWEEEANLFLDDIVEVSKRGVEIITFSFGRIPYECGKKYTYNISASELSKVWRRRRIIVVVDRERIIIGEGNDKIDEISIITSNTMLIELAIDQMLLDILHLHELKKGGYLPSNIEYIEQYTQATKMFNKNIGIDEGAVPKRVDQD